MGSNIDEDFASRYQTMIQFAIPGPEERYRLWTNAFSGSVRLDVLLVFTKLQRTMNYPGRPLIRSFAIVAGSYERGKHHRAGDDLYTAIREALKKENQAMGNDNL